MPRANTLDWKTYESITKYIYETLGKQSGVTIKGYGNNCKVVGKSGLCHQIDVHTSHTEGNNTYETAIECKFRKEKVNKDVVMKLFAILEDTGISKGIIISKSGFTRDGIQYAKHKNIGIVNLREYEEKDLKGNSHQIDIATLDLNIKINSTRPEITSIDIGDNRKIEIKDEFDYFAYIVMLKNGNRVSFYDYVNDFRKEINRKNYKTKPLTGKYKILGGKLLNRQTGEKVDLDEIIFTGQLTESDDNRNLKYTIIDKVWLLMKSIFEERTFSLSENGIIIEHKKKDL
ncbi:restriction endonuclease [Flavobacterium capsici]|uniref:Restriction endonuclease n=1 Tax=Flavobacterium capsici TaxID=3075618 RepID=A0AA96EWK4_9FLAO|nr:MULTISPECIES: restriction endonuclease [unclassified Flavobacterium]WNM18488.1 restriction endonuclease [Flavobacterium sp. PMR2A8]WNM22539.1 restriction endonuclease [Flavobacterium sp. PMTSA4]